jgi:hypothetical protein
VEYLLTLLFYSELSRSCLFVVQTIAIVPVLPRGVLQLGSTSVVIYPIFSKWNIIYHSIQLEVVLCHYYIVHDILLYDCATLLTVQMFCSLDLYIN